MRVLVTGAASSLGKAIATELSASHHVRLTDKDPFDTELEFVQSDLGHDESTDALVHDIDVLVHLPYTPRPGDGQNEWLDVNSRRHYNLLLAASEAGVARALVLSTLDPFMPYDANMPVSENWQPLPNTEPAQLGPHIAEFTAREFAHSNALDVIVLRLGHVVRAEEVAGQPYDPMWLDERDAAEAVSRLLADAPALRRQRAYRVLHLQSVSERARFSSDRLCKSLDFTPRHSFEEGI